MTKRTAVEPANQVTTFTAGPKSFAVTSGWVVLDDIEMATLLFRIYLEFMICISRKKEDEGSCLSTATT